MEKLLEKYLRNYYKNEDITIRNYNVDGAICFVKFNTDESKYYTEQININIWEMVVYLNS